MNRSRIVLICCFTLVFAACSKELYQPLSQETIIEKTVEKEVPRDTVIIVQPDSTILSALVECNERGQARLKEIEQLRNSQRAQTSLKMEDNRLEVKTVVDSMEIYLLYKERYKEKEKIETVTVTETVEVNVLHWWQEALIRVGAVSLAVIVLWVAFRLLKPRLNGILTVIKNFLTK